MASLFPSIMRTAVPLAAGLLLALAARAGLGLSGETATAAATAGISAAYYGLFRGLEAAAARLRWRPLQTAAGAFLGWARPPQYPPRRQDQDDALRLASGDPARY